MVNIFKLFFIIFALFLSPWAFSKDFFANQSLENVYGVYAVEEVERYRGGLTSQEEALSRIGALITVEDKKFLFWESLTCENPIYKVDVHNVLSDEGSIPGAADRHGNFYGYGVDREFVRTLLVSCQNSDGASYLFEVVENELWLFLDGWFYKLEKAPSDGGLISLIEHQEVLLKSDAIG